MSNVYTDFPKPIREAELAKSLSSIQDDKLHLWFGLNFIPDVRDIDILLYHEDAGFFVIEVKAVFLEQIEEFGWQKCKLQGRRKGESPHMQASEASHSFLDFLRPQISGSFTVPFFAATACFPLIKREDWHESWDDERIIGNFSNSLIFQEDIEQQSETLINRLQYIRKNPPAKQGSQYRHFHKTAILEKIKDCLEVNAKKKPALSDLEKLKILERDVKNNTKRKAQELLNSGKKIWLRGYPGTGKTFRLLQIGLCHVFAAQEVLYVCYNKVLASDLRRLFSYSSQLPSCQSSLIVYDIFAIVRKYKGEPAADDADDYDKWGERVLKRMKSFVEDGSIPYWNEYKYL